MKTSTAIYFLLIVCLSFSSCTKKQLGVVLIPQNLAFEFIGKDGKSLITSIKDSVKVSYLENGTTKFYDLTIMKLYVDRTADSTKLSVKYNGLVISDKAFMGNKSIRTSNPIHNYIIYLNGKTMGSLYLDYIGYLEISTHASSLLFNNTSVLTDTSQDFFFPNSSVHLLPIQ